MRRSRGTGRPERVNPAKPGRRERGHRSWSSPRIARRLAKNHSLVTDRLWRAAYASFGSSADSMSPVALRALARARVAVSWCGRFPAGLPGRTCPDRHAPPLAVPRMSRCHLHRKSPRAVCHLEFFDFRSRDGSTTAIPRLSAVIVQSDDELVRRAIGRNFYQFAQRQHLAGARQARDRRRCRLLRG